MLLGLHTFNLITDVADSLVLTAVMFKEPLEGKRFVDVAENSGYWNFVVVSWVPIYAVVYWGPRF
jgi:heme/copper-type cytochrome/quinol oxidase subunit 3